MSFVIYHKDSTLLLNGTRYVTEAAAKGALTKMVNNAPTDESFVKTDWHIAEHLHFSKCIEKTETKTNLMSGTAFTQPVNTPMSCDPSTETYWSM